MADYYKWYKQDIAYKQDVTNFYLLAVNVPAPGIGSHGYTMVMTPNIGDGHISPQYLGPKNWSAVEEPSKEIQDRLFKAMRRLKLNRILVGDIFEYHEI